MSFTWEKRRGRLVVAGHDISDQATAIVVAAEARQMPVVTVTLAEVRGHLEGQALVTVGGVTAALLVELGWTPPVESDPA